MPDSSKDFSVLVVDDSQTSRIKLAAAIKALGHNVHEADGGLRRLRCWARRILI